MTDPRCALHPDEKAVETCSRCGRFVCLGCRLTLEGRSYCVPCSQRVAGGWSAPGKLSSWALGLGVLGVFAPCFPPFILASVGSLVLGVMVLRSGLGTVGASNHRRAVGAVVLAILGLLVSGAAGLHLSRHLRG